MSVGREAGAKGVLCSSPFASQKQDKMDTTTKPRIKICCIRNSEEAWLAIRYGASAIGLVSEMPSGPGVIPEARIIEIAASVPPGIATFLLTCKQDVSEIVEQQRRCGTNTIQLVDALQHGTHAELKAALPGIGIVQVIHVVDESSIAEAENVAPHVDAILLDSGNPKLKVKELGGTGRVHNWETSRKIRERVDVPVYLAGGLKPKNIKQAAEQVGAFGLDMCSGVRTEGRLDEAKVAAVFEQI